MNRASVHLLAVVLIVISMMGTTEAESWGNESSKWVADPVAVATGMEVGPQPNVSCDAAKSEEIVVHMRKVLSETERFSGRMIITHCGRLILDECRGLADRATGVPVSKEMLFDVGSLTKQFVAAAILHLRDQGQLTLLDRLGGYFVDLPPQTAEITLHQLMTHSSGLPLYSGRDYAIVGKADFIAWLKQTALEFPPGTAESYSNPGFTTLALIVEQVSGESFEVYLRDRLLTPLGIQDTGYRLPFGPLAINYSANGERDGTPLEHAWGPYGPYWNLFGGGGMLSTAADMAKWFEALHGGRVLSARSTAEMFTGHVPLSAQDGVRNGYGWRIIDDEHGLWVNHGGSNGATFFADVRWFEASDATMVLTLNSFDPETIRTIVRGFAAVSGKPIISAK